MASKKRQKEAPTAPPAPVWLNCRAGAARLGISRYEFMKRVALGRIRVLAEPGMSIKYSVEDIDRIAAERTPQPASA